MSDWSKDDNDMREIKNQIKKANKKILKKARKRDRKEMCDPPIPLETTETIKKAVDIAEKYIDLVSCDSDCQYNVEKERLADELKHAEKIYNTAPDILEGKQRKYYNHISQKEDINFDIYQEQDVDKILKETFDKYNERFDHYLKLAEEILNEENPVRKHKLVDYLKQLDTMYITGTRNNSKKQLNIGNYKIADRMSFFYNNSIETFNTLNSMIITVIIMSNITYFCVISFYYKQFVDIIKRVLPSMLSFYLLYYTYKSNTLKQ